MKVIIKNMVCKRCIIAVEAEASRLGVKPLRIGLGEVVFEKKDATSTFLFEFENAIKSLGFQIIKDSRSRLIEKIKNVVVQNVHHAVEGERISWSKIISSEINYDFNYLSYLFSSEVGITLEKFIILQKTEKIKEYLLYDELTVDEIAWRMGYSSGAYLSSQFRKVTGYSPVQFKKLIDKDRSPLDKVGIS